jgi:hypothetical protein
LGWIHLLYDWDRLSLIQVKQFHRMKVVQGQKNANVLSKLTAPDA